MQEGLKRGEGTRRKRARIIILGSRKGKSWGSLLWMETFIVNSPVFDVC